MTLVSSVDAITESMQVCVTAQETLLENNELDSALRALLLGYNATCHDEKLCTYQMDAETMEGFLELQGSGGKAPEATDLPAVKGTGSADFGGSFRDHNSYTTYTTACSDAGGSVICVDAHATMEGSAGVAYIGGDGIETDVKLKLTSFPMCMAMECANEDITLVLENTVKTVMLQSDKVEDMNSNTENLIQGASIKMLCDLSGLDTCEMVVEECSSASHIAGGIAKFLSFAFILLFTIA